MALKLKENLLLDILNPLEKQNKYSKGILNLKTALELEKEEGFEVPEKILNDFAKLEKRSKSFINNIPLVIVEKYFYKNQDKFKKEVFVKYAEHSFNKPINEIYLELEQFYNELFITASMLANYYNLEIKMKTKTNNEYA